MPIYLIELYLPRTSSQVQAAETARRVEEAAAIDGSAIRYVRTLFVPEDETCFHVFEASSRDAVVEAAARAGLEGAHVTQAVQSDDELAGGRREPS